MASSKVWTTLITNKEYIPGLLALNFSLKRAGSKYPLVVLYTDALPKEIHDVIDAHKIPKKKVDYLLPSEHKDYANDPRFYDCWTKMSPFSLTEYERVVMLDSDMIVLQNMDELMDLPLDDPSLGGKGNRVFGGSHACACNPLKKEHYPKDWIPENCAFTTQHSDPDKAQVEGAPSSAGAAMVNGGLLVINPSAETYKLILERLSNPEYTSKYAFADQSLLSDLFRDRWVPIPYIYNALKALRWKSVHSAIWRDDKVKNVHFILSPKPWEEDPNDMKDESHKWWWDMERQRRLEEGSSE